MPAGKPPIAKVKVAGDNEAAIAALVRLVLDFNDDEDSRCQAAKILGEIAYGNQIAIAALVELLDVSSDRDTRRVVADSLAKTVKGSKGKLEAIAALVGNWALPSPS